MPETAHADKARPLTPEIRPAPKLKPNPFVAARSRSTVRDLATEARVELPQPSPPTVAPSTPATSVTAATPTVVERDAIKFLRAMPAEFQKIMHGTLSVLVSERVKMRTNAKEAAEPKARIAPTP